MTFTLSTLPGPLRSSSLIRLFAVLLVIAPMALRAQATSPAMALGSVNVGSSATATVTFTFSGSTTVSSISVLTQGATGLDFQLNTSSPGTCTATAYSGSDVCTVNVTFAPLFAGTRYGAALLLSGSNVVATGIMTGVGTGGQPAFPLSSAPTLFSSSSGALYFFSVDGAGNLYIAEPGTGIVKITPSGTKSNFFSSPSVPIFGIAIDPAGNVWAMQDVPGKVLREFNQAGTLLATYSNNGFFGYQMAFGTDGTLYGAYSGQIFTYNILTGTVGHLTVSGYTFTALGVAVDGNNTVYISDIGNNQIIEVTSGGTASVLPITGTAISSPEGIAVDAAGNIYLAESGGAILHITPAGVSTPMINTGVSSPWGIALSGSGMLYMDDQGNSGIYQWNLLSAGFASTGTTAIGSSSTEQDATLENDGNASLSLGSISAPAPAHTASGTTCSTSTPLAVDATCIAGIVFRPTANGVPPETGTETYSGTGFTAATETITGTATGDATQLVWGTSPPASLQNGQSAGTLTVLLEDGSGSPTALTSSVTLTVTGSNSYSQQYTVNAVNGTATFDLSSAALPTGTYSYQATSTGLTATPADSETVYPYQLAITAGPATPITAGGNAGTVQVTIENNDGTTATSQTTSVTLMVSGPGSYLQTYTQSASAGIAAFNLSSVALTASGSYSYQASATGLTSSSTSGETVNAAAISQLTVTPASTSLYSGVADSMTVRAYDTYGNAVSSTDTIALTSTDSTATLPANFALAGGSGSANVSFNQAGTFTVTASDVTNNTVTAATTSPSITVSPVPVFTVTVATDAGGTTCTANAGANPGSPCELRAAMSAANTLAFTGTTGVQPIVNFAPALYASGSATITLASTISMSNNFALTGPGASSLTISGGGSTRILQQSAPGMANTVSGLTLTHGSAGAGGAWSSTVNGVFNFTNDVFTANTSPTSGAITGGAVALTNAPTVTITGCTFSSNAATSASNTSQGGALYQTGGTLTITNSLFSGNTATAAATANGGALYLSTVKMSISGSRFLTNSASSTGTSGVNGGAISASASVVNSTLVNSLFSGNSATGLSTTVGILGGALFLNAGAVTITGSTFTGNSVSGSAAVHEGGAIYNTGTTLGLYNDTISGNSSSFVAGGLFRVSGTVTANNTVISKNTAAGSFPDVDGVLTQPSSYIDSAAVCSSNCNPMLSALGDYGGPTQTMVPLPGSPLLQAGSTSLLNGATTDQRGYPRTLNSKVDIGAVETNYALVFSTQPATSYAGSVVTGPAAVLLTESGAIFPVATAIALTDTSGTLTGGTASTSASTGIATFSSAVVPSTQASDALTATMQLNTSASTTLTVGSNSFTVTGPQTFANLVVSALATKSESGQSQSFTVTAYAAGGAVMTSFVGTVTLTSTDGAAVFSTTSYTFQPTDNGVHTFTVTFNTIGAQSITATSGVVTATQPTTVITNYIWVLNADGTLAKLSEAGSIITSNIGSSNSAATAGGVAIDSVGDLWSVISSVNQLLQTTKTGANPTTYTGGGLSAPVALAVDGNGYVWIANSTGSVSVFTNAGGAVTPSAGYTGGNMNTPSGISIDIAGNVWVSNSGNASVTEILGGAAPSPPLAVGVQNGTLGARP